MMIGIYIVIGLLIIGLLALWIDRWSLKEERSVWQDRVRKKEHSIG